MAKRPTREEAERMTDEMLKSVLITDPIEPLISTCGGIKKPLQSPLALTDKERAALRASALADMEKHGFTTPEELIDYYDRKRGY